MSIVTTSLEFLGLNPVHVADGFRRNSRGPRLPVCETCGAVVAFEMQRSHIDWHSHAGQ